MAKCLKYLHHTTLCDYMFGIFMVAWFFARHVLFLLVCWSVWAHSPIYTPYACFTGTGPVANLTGPFDLPEGFSTLRYMVEPLWKSDGLVCFNATVSNTFLASLLFLQALTLIWFSMIIGVAAKVIRGGSAEDSRSGDEEEEDGPEEDEASQEGDEVVAEVEKRRRTLSNGGSISHLGSSAERKELLGRIGCEKQVE